MLKSILVGLDGSPFSRNALELVIGWARRSDAMVVGLGIVDEPTLRRSEMMPIGAATFKEHADATRLARATRQVELLLEQFSLRCAEAGVSSKVLEAVGEPYEMIQREAQRYDVIVLGKQTHFHFATQNEPCDTLTTVLKNTPRPVVAVPDAPAAGSSIVIAYDGSLQAARALQAFLSAGLIGADDVHVLTVGKDRVEASRHTDRALDFLGFHGVKATAHALSTSESPAHALLEQARRLQARLIVMGAYGQPAIKEFFLGSVTRSFLNESPTPLFLYH